ncbi:TPA: hypothetical protein ACX4EL_003759 [Yersinia enterocolitica]|uniref:hypothetical protein n=1 Tax=Yersinia enterocolitica TaxID=630 RepID=UPI0021E8000C|nr:hypothetical protein [Yersinia enterocolitica]EKN3946288.1 hypothetical protein [Yersinia enterocolitica]EKN5071160.1 hypothetical protein [Yersinia enterocolitica]EKN6315937.1 hypothetical protein [Yersinia enterocolitica]UYJ95888.1 hypothetical protein N4W06_13290 [Yersinia enterocolitica]HDL6672167.1 hypothetical protein [Yersinia enterocolitica]
MKTLLKVAVIFLISVALYGCVAPTDWIAKEETFNTEITYYQVNNDEGKVKLTTAPSSLNENHLRRLDGSEQTFFQLYYGGYFSVFAIQNPAEFDTKINLLNDFIHWSRKASSERQPQLNIAKIFTGSDEGHYSFIDVDGEPYLQAVWGNGSNSYFPTHNFNIALDTRNVKLLLKQVELARNFTFR